MKAKLDNSQAILDCVSDAMRSMQVSTKPSLTGYVALMEVKKLITEQIAEYDNPFTHHRIEL